MKNGKRTFFDAYGKNNLRCFLSFGSKCGFEEPEDERLIVCLLLLVGDSRRILFPKGYNYYGTGGLMTFNQNIVPKYFIQPGLPSLTWSEAVHGYNAYLDATAQTCIIRTLPNPPFTRLYPNWSFSTWLYIYLLHTELLAEWLATPCILVDSLLVAW